MTSDCGNCSLLPEVSGANIFLTLQCNLDCPYCYVRKNQTRMAPEVVEQTIDFVAQLARDTKGFFHTGFLGGEPFLRFSQLRYVTDELEDRSGRPISFTVTTNGTVLTDDMITWIRDRDIRLVLSLDGDAATMADRPYKVNGRGSYDSVIRTMRKLDRAEIPYLIQMTITQSNVARLSANVRHVVSLGARRVIFGLASNDTWTISERSDLIRELGRVFEFYKQIFRTEGDVFLKFVHDEVGGYLLRRHLGGDPYACGMLRHVVAVSVDGGVYPCQAMVNFPDQLVGHVSIGLNEERVRQAVLPLVTEMPRCMNCALRDYCRKCLAFNRATSTEVLRNPDLACTTGMTTAVLAQDFVETMLQERNPRFASEFVEALRWNDPGAGCSRQEVDSADELLTLLLRVGPLQSESDLPVWPRDVFGVPEPPAGDLGHWHVGTGNATTGEGRGKINLEFGAYRRFAGSLDDDSDH